MQKYSHIFSKPASTKEIQGLHWIFQQLGGLPLPEGAGQIHSGMPSAVLPLEDFGLVLRLTSPKIRWSRKQGGIKLASKFPVLRSQFLLRPLIQFDLPDCKLQAALQPAWDVKVSYADSLRIKYGLMSENLRLHDTHRHNSMNLPVYGDPVCFDPSYISPLGHIPFLPRFKAPIKTRLNASVMDLRPRSDQGVDNQDRLYGDLVAIAAEAFEGRTDGDQGKILEFFRQCRISRLREDRLKPSWTVPHKDHDVHNKPNGQGQGRFQQISLHYSRHLRKQGTPLARLAEMNLAELTAA